MIFEKQISVILPRWGDTVEWLPYYLTPTGARVDQARDIFLISGKIPMSPYDEGGRTRDGMATSVATAATTGAAAMITAIGVIYLSKNMREIARG